MKFLNDQRRMYLLSAGLLALTIALCCTWSLWGDRTADSPAAADDAIENAASAEPSVTPQLRETVSPLNWLGAAVIVIGILLVNLGRH